MTTSRFERFLPWTGVLAGLLFATAAARTSTPDVAKGAATQMRYYADHHGLVVAQGLASGLFLVAVAMFATALRQALRSGEPGESSYSSVAYGGGLLVGLAMASNGLLMLAADEAAQKHQAQVVQTLAFIMDVSWVPWVASSAVMMLGTGLGGLRTAALPRWLSLVTTVLGVLCLLGPTGIAVFLVSPLWFVVTGVVLVRRSRQQERAVQPVHPSYVTQPA